MGFFEWLMLSPVGIYVSETQVAYYSLLAGHAIGMGVVVGITWMFAARLIGYAATMPVAVFDRLFRLTWAGFILNALTGALLFCANSKNLIQNAPFLLKISCIALGGVALWFLGRRVDAEREALEQGAAATFGTKAVALLTMALWILAILAGRIIAYTVEYI